MLMTPNACMHLKYYRITIFTEHWRTLKSKYSRPAEQTLSTRRLYSIQISSMDPKTSILHGSLSECSYQTFNTQVARIVSVNHLCLSSYPWDDEDGDHKNGRRKS